MEGNKIGESWADEDETDYSHIPILDSKFFGIVELHSNTKNAVLKNEVKDSSYCHVYLIFTIEKRISA